MREYRSTIYDSNNEILEYCEFSRKHGYTRSDFRAAINSLLASAIYDNIRYLVYSLSLPGRLPSLKIECIQCLTSIDTYVIFINHRYFKSITVR